MSVGDTILLVAEDGGCRTFLATNLAQDGYRVLLAADTAGALAVLAVRRPVLIVADLGRGSIALLDAVRGAEDPAGRADAGTPVIVLADWRDELARVRVFEHDGDDVITKPFLYAELRGLIRVVLGRSDGQRQRRIIRVGVLTMDLAAREVHVGEQDVRLTGTEFELLRVLASDPGRVFTKRELLRDVWRRDARNPTRTVDAHVARLRAKLAVAAKGKMLVRTVRGVGYQLVEIPQAKSAA
jgi:DNA-binding response OmpR family regulator